MREMEVLLLVLVVVECCSGSGFERWFGGDLALLVVVTVECKM